MSPAGGGATAEVALADTSLFVALEQQRPMAAAPPARVAVSVVTVGELQLGVLAAADGPTRARRLATLSAVTALQPLPIDEAVAQAWAGLRLALRDAGLHMPLNDSWIAATAMANDLAVVTQDHDYDAVPGLRVLRI